MIPEQQTEHPADSTGHLYRIVVDEILEQHWESWFENMQLTNTGGRTIITGSIADQAALHGLLNRIRDLNLTLVSVARIVNDLNSE